MKKRQLTHAFNKEAGFTTNPTLSPPFNRDADQKGQKNYNLLPSFYTQLSLSQILKLN